MNRRLHIPHVVIQNLAKIGPGNWVTIWTSDLHKVIAGSGETEEKSLEDAKYIFNKYVVHPEPGEYESFQVTH